jgi:hypothetical protein
MSAFEQLLCFIRGIPDFASRKDKGIDFILSLHPREHQGLFEEIERTIRCFSITEDDSKYNVEIHEMLQYGKVSKKQFLALYKISPRLAIAYINYGFAGKKLGDLISLMTEAKVTIDEARLMLTNAWQSPRLEYGDFQQAVTSGYKEIFMGIVKSRYNFRFGRFSDRGWPQSTTLSRFGMSRVRDLNAESVMEIRKICSTVQGQDLRQDMIDHIADGPCDRCVNYPGHFHVSPASLMLLISIGTAYTIPKEMCIYFYKEEGDDTPVSNLSDALRYVAMETQILLIQYLELQTDDYACDFLNTLAQFFASVLRFPYRQIRKATQFLRGELVNRLKPNLQQFGLTKDIIRAMIMVDRLVLPEETNGIAWWISKPTYKQLCKEFGHRLVDEFYAFLDRHGCRQEFLDGIIRER